MDEDTIRLIWKQVDLINNKYVEDDYKSDNIDEFFDESEGKTTIVDNYFSDQHGSSPSYYFPNNSTRTYISGNSKMSKLHLWVSTDSTERILRDDIDLFKTILNNYLTLNVL